MFLCVVLCTFCVHVCVLARSGQSHQYCFHNRFSISRKHFLSYGISTYFVLNLFFLVNYVLVNCFLSIKLIRMVFFILWCVSQVILSKAWTFSRCFICYFLFVYSVWSGSFLLFWDVSVSICLLSLFFSRFSFHTLWKWFKHYPQIKKFVLLSIFFSYTVKEKSTFWLFSSVRTVMWLSLVLRVAFFL